jgi:DNA-binding winged helix-turn-helix (wHTH) protein
MRVAFLDWVLDSEVYALSRNGRRVAIEPRVFDLIAYLIAQRGRLVPKIELLQNVWNGVRVSPSALNRCICLARQLIGDPSVIRTVHGRGYQWATPVAPAVPDEPALARAAR